MNNLEKATKIANLVLKLDYNGDLMMFQEENGYWDKFIQDVYFWLEDGNGNGMTADECRLFYEL